MGLYDDKAFIENAVALNGSYTKAFYVGYSQGSIQMFYSLANLEESFHASNTFKVLTYTPCFYFPAFIDANGYAATIDLWDQYSVYAYDYLTAEADNETICTN